MSGNADTSVQEVRPVRVVGYVRETADPGAGATAFAQQEELRRHAAEHGHHLVAVCQDTRVPGSAPTRHGYRSVLGVIAAGGVDAVLVPRLSTFSSDAIVQEIMLWDLRRRGVRVVSTDPVDLSLLDDEERPDAERIVIRDVLERVGEHAREVAGVERLDASGTDVLIEIVEADRAEA